MRSHEVERSRRRFLAKHELIGLAVRVEEASDPSQRGREGRVVDETLKTLVLEAHGKELRIPKKGATFRFLLDGDVVVRGERLLYRPEDRVKKAR